MTKETAYLELLKTVLNPNPTIRKETKLEPRRTVTEWTFDEDYKLIKYVFEDNEAGFFIQHKGRTVNIEQIIDIRHC